MNIPGWLPTLSFFTVHISSGADIFDVTSRVTSVHAENLSQTPSTTQNRYNRKTYIVRKNSIFASCTVKTETKFTGVSLPLLCSYHQNLYHLFFFQVPLQPFDQYFRFRCKKSGYFTRPVKNITNRIFMRHKQGNNDTKNQQFQP